MTGVIADRSVPSVAVVTVSNPKRRNAINLELSARLERAVVDAVADSEVRALVITGAAPGFCAGGDLDELRMADESVLRRLYAGFLALADCPLPTIAAVNGPAVGAGLNLALSCDVRLAGPTARFDSRFMKIGLHPGGGYTWMVHRAVGAQAAAALTLLGETVDAAEAERLGLVLRSYPSDREMLDAAVAMASQTAASSQDLMKTTKNTMLLAAGPSTHSQVMEVEVKAQAASIGDHPFQSFLRRLQT